jgi:aspartate racemase
MKTIGLIGGLSWTSTAEYYRLLNELTAQRTGGAHCAKVILYSLDFGEVERIQHEGRWDEAARLLTDAGRALKAAGADFLLICSNTMHIVADAVQEGTGLPLLHIADVTGDVIKRRDLKRVGLLGTKFVMEGEFYRRRLEEKFGLDVLLPDEEGREVVHRVIYDELCKGVVAEGSRVAYLEIVERLTEEGAEGIILGCTEITLLLKPKDVSVPVFDTTRLHAEAAVEMALGGG